MYLNQLTPKNRYLEYIPDVLLDDDVPPSVFPSLAHYLAPTMHMDQYIGFIQGLTNINQIVRGENDDYDQGTKARWFSTDKVVDVRLFFRNADKTGDKSILGSKMRLYSIGTPYRSTGNEKEVQHLDSGFINYNMYGGPSMCFQNAMAKTMLYNSLYAIGGRASVRKVNEVPKSKNNNAPAVGTYRWVSALRPLRCDETDWDDYFHILHPAAIEAGIDNPKEFFADFGGNAMLDDLMKVFLNSSSMNDLADRLLDVRGLELQEDEVEDIIASSNTRAANLSNSDDFANAEGINMVETMRVLYDILGE